MTQAAASSVRTFLIADIRGHSRYTEECGDEAAAALAAKLEAVVNEDVEAHDGELVEIRGDEALVVFSSARQAIRAAVDLQAQSDGARTSGPTPAGATPAGGGRGTT
jgi:class 3 adenylate cyclase